MNDQLTVEDLIIEGKKQINSMHAKMLLADLLSTNVLELLLILDQKVPSDIVKQYYQELQALKENKPIQYVIGHVNFYGNPFFVTKDVLIPRFETEELVENVINYIKNHSQEKLNVLDLGCGSGAIGLTIKKLCQEKVDVTLVDISSKALEITKKNALNLQLSVTIKQSDWFQNINEKFDIIISNPPYIAQEEEIEPIVKENEPHLALYGGKDGLDCYKKIFQQAPNYVTSNYLLAFEIGQYQKEALTNLAKYYFKDATITIKKDLQGRNRMLFVQSSTD